MSTKAVAVSQGVGSYRSNFGYINKATNCFQGSTISAKGHQICAT